MIEESYWGGSSLQKSNEVRRLEATDFKGFVAGYITSPVRMGMTKAEFMARPDRDEVKDCAFISPVTYPYEKSGKRGIAHAEALCLVVLDCDEDPRPEVMATIKDLAENPKAIAEHLHPFDVVAYHTAKSTPERPRIKIIVPVNRCDPSWLPRLVRYIAGRMGLPADFKGVAESSRPSQGHYRPVVWKGEAFTAVLVTRTRGTSLDVSLLPPEDSALDELLDGRRFTHGQTADSALGLLYLPVRGVEEVDQVRDVFDHLDPDCTRIEWLEAAAALLHQFGTDPDQAEMAYEFFVEWSSKGTKFRGEGDTWAIWKTLKPYPEGKAPVTMRTLFKRAQKAGWDGGAIARSEQEEFEAWAERCDQAEELMREGPERIASMAVENAILADSMLLLLQARLKATTGRRIEKKAVYHEVCKARKRQRDQREEAREKEEDDLPFWLRGICFVSTENVFFDYGLNCELTPAAFNMVYGRHLMPEETPPNAKPLALPTDFAMHVAHLPVVEAKLYNPRHQGEDRFFQFEGKTFLNTYDPLSPPTAEPEHSEEAGALCVNHIYTMIPERRYADWFLDFMTICVQQPGLKIPWAPCLQSAEGAGKNLITEILAAVVGEVNCKWQSAEVIRSPFNDWWLAAQIQFLNEIHFPGDRREAVMNSLKPLVSDPIITINKKFESARSRMPNYTNCIAMTNHHDALHLRETNRRWFMLRCAIQTFAEMHELVKSGHFERLQILKGEWAGALRYWFLQRRISEDFPMTGPAPVTSYARAIAEESKNAIQISIEDAIADGVSPFVGADVIALRPLSEILPEEQKRKAAKITHYLTTMGYEKWEGMHRPRVAGHRTDVWVHRKHYCPDLGSPLEIMALKAKMNGKIREI